MSLPRISHLQFFVLAALTKGERSGKELRDQLDKAGHRKSGPAFYQLMARLEDAEFVSGRYEQKVVMDQTIKERAYKLTEAGAVACDQLRLFHSQPWCG